MPRRPEGLARFTDQIVLAACVALSLLVMTRDEEQRIAWGTALAHRITTPVEAAASRLEHMRALRAENDELRARIASMELDAAHIIAERARIEDLERRAGFFERSRGRLVPARTLELVVSRFPVQAKIQVFGADSLHVLQPVVDERGLVGRISSTLAPDVALVQLLTDLESRISVEDVATGVVGILRYDGRRFLMDHVPRGEPIEVGDAVHTSGLGGTVPRGLAVGTVSELRSSPSELFQQITIEPNVRFTGLGELYVVVRPGPWYTREGMGLYREQSPSDAPVDSLGAEGMGR